MDRYNSKVSFISGTSSRKTRGLGKKTLARKAVIEKDHALSITKEKTSTVKTLICKCAKSKCLKMYCECFTNKRYCDESCLCKGCLNSPDHRDKITAARKSIRNRNPQAFKSKILT